MEPGADLGDDFHRQEAARACGLLRRHAACDPVEKRPGEHVARTREILGLACERLNVRLGPVMSNKGTMRTVGGFSGVFVDLDGHPWEVAHNPHWTLGPDGSVQL